MIDILLMILYLTIVLGVLVVLHEGGHYLVARLCGVRVTEFMIGLPGPSIGFTFHGTKFGVTCIPLGGYARVCGMESGEESPYLTQALEYVYAQGQCESDDFAKHLEISDEEAMAALYELVEWGSITGPKRKDKFNTFRTPRVDDRKAGIHLEEGSPRPLDDPRAFYESERSQTYRSISFWKRTAILLAGPLANLVFAIVMFIFVFSIMGLDYYDADGVLRHATVDVGQSISVGFSYIWAVIQAVAALFNPQTAADTVSNSASVVGMAALSKQYADAGLAMFLMFMSMISVSLGIMNMIPIPPLDGGRFAVEIYQAIARRMVTQRVMNALTVVGVSLFLVLFVVMAGQDIQRFF